MNIYEKLKRSLNLKSSPIGVKLIYSNGKELDIDKKFNKVNKIGRYCEFVKRASKGEFIKLEKRDFLCLNAELVLGFKKPMHIKIDMRLNNDNLKHILLFPINEYEMEDVNSIILIVTPRNCTDILEAYVKIFNKPLAISIGATMGACGEVTSYVIKNKKMNFSFACNGARIYSGFDDCELLCGIPIKQVATLSNELEFIAKERKIDMEMVKKLKNYD